MKNKLILSILMTLLLLTGYSQTEENSSINVVFKGLVIDLEKGLRLPYGNIIVLHKNTGTISNEKGEFSIDISALEKSDTLSFQYIGYQTRNISIKDLENTSEIYLKENIFNIAEIFVFGRNPNPKTIIKKVLSNKKTNYKTTNTKRQVFIRQRYISNIKKLEINLNKSTFEELNEGTINTIKTKTPKHSTSYTDFLGYIYFLENKKDTNNLKIEDIKTVSLKEKDVADLKQLENTFKKLFSETNGKEYWKIKSGFFGKKIDFDNDTRKDSTKEKNNIKTAYYSNSITKKLKYSSLNNKREWDFLYNTSKYKYTLEGGTNVNGEDVYIINFKPKKNGVFKGRVYIAIKSFALIRADYEYAKGKISRNISLLGVKYTENHFKASIFFEKKEGSYQLKYFSKETGNKASIKRELSLLKRKEQFIFDKTLKEIETDINISVKTRESFEVLILEHKNISAQQYANFKQKESMKIIYVDQFNDKLWKGFSIIEPTQQMKEYKKKTN